MGQGRLACTISEYFCCVLHRILKYIEIRTRVRIIVDDVLDLIKNSAKIVILIFSEIMSIFSLTCPIGNSCYATDPPSVVPARPTQIKKVASVTAFDSRIREHSIHVFGVY